MLQSEYDLAVQKLRGKRAKQIILRKTWPKTDFLPKSQKNFFGLRVFDMGRSSYMKHEYFFPWPYIDIASNFLPVHRTWI